MLPGSLCSCDGKYTVTKSCKPIHSCFLCSLGHGDIAQLFFWHLQGWQWGGYLPGVGNCHSLKASHYHIGSSTEPWAMRNEWLASVFHWEFLYVLIHQIHPSTVLWHGFQVLRIWCLQPNLVPLLWFLKLLTYYANIHMLNEYFLTKFHQLKLDDRFPIT